MSLAWLDDPQTDFGRTLRNSRAAEIKGFVAELRAKYDAKSEQDFRLAVRACIGNYGLDPQQIADSCHVSQGTVSRWQNGKVLPPPGIRQLVAEELVKLLLKQLQDSALE